MRAKDRTLRLVASSICGCLIAALTAIGSPAAHASGGTLVYGVNPFDNGSVGDSRGLQAFDTSTGLNIGGAHSTVVGGRPAGTVLGATGLAIDPTTGTAYTLLRLNDFENPRVLATIDLTSGDATVIGDTGMKLSSITFDSTGTLFAVTGRGNDSNTPNPCQGCLYTLSKTDATHAPVLKQLSNCPGVTGSCGHGIAFDSQNGLIYHTSGDDAHPTFETVMTTAPYTVTPVGYDAQGVTPDTLYGIGYDAATDQFVGTDWNLNVYVIKPNGLATLLADKTRLYLKGLYVSPDPVPTDNPPTAVDDTMTTSEGQSATISATDNDTDPDAGTEFVASYTQPAHGSVSFYQTSGHVSGGDFRSFPQNVYYFPEPAYCNDGLTTDDFTYTLNGGSTATVHVTVDCVPFQGPLVFGADPGANSPTDGGLKSFDAATGVTQSQKFITTAFGSKITGDVADASALAMNPRDRKVYAVLYMTATSLYVLATIDPSTGDAVTIDDLQHSIVAMTFGSDGTLYGASDGSDPTCADCLFVINTSTAAAKIVKHLSNPNSYEGIAFDPRDGKLYRATYTDFQSFDPKNSFKVTNIGYGGLVPGCVDALGYDPVTGGLYMTDCGDVRLLSTNGGLSAPLSSLTESLHGLVVANPALSLKYSATKKRFSGALVTPMIPGCDGVRTVSIFKETSGPPTLLGTAPTDSNGKFVLAKRVGPGRYHASVDPGPDSGGFPCAGGTSKTIAVR